MTLTGDLDDMLDPILRVFAADLTARVNGHVALIYMAGQVQVTKWAGLPYEGPPMEQALRYAGKHCATLVKGMDLETKTRLAEMISKGIEEKRGIPGLARDIRKGFESMTKVRSETIARTESCDALEQAFMDRAEQMGIEGKEWIVTEPCPVCEEFGDLGVVPLNHTYVSTIADVSVDRPPAHPACRCALAPARLAVR